ncbi:MAG: mechanosensitive ion channel family protein [Oscillatoriales cyanobacterium]|uniref:Mechanosensitive ion channel family protein n=1 Tax=Microcoleus anatoxicus PTRS2 TaxID=2705321 RepID=A0ABU8YUP5_9CYAN|nr:MAG: mechanosensitive ion channel family protein [Oscillatoriales cyanobacterium]TAD99296.1 MAG: mechanosensitive ion channel family protein [Oscillatoriales cyanobacterium]TAE02055.1 MAG: mechanosensitive ion channel family protein [Oscillatoriales cyanobacterium]TAE97353.1 MAG: mechanosensitive ion channel family protein [Oscillatoriales cyanobacterium]TAF60724.1 MAG: mechanosensitive ion channel family protein [Oscillatoriales cyanobacterium]
MIAIAKFQIIAQTLYSQLDTERIQALQVAQELSKKFIELGFEIVPKLLWAIGILLMTRFAIGIAGRVTRRALSRTEATLRKFLVQAAEITILVIGVIATLSQLGIQTTSVVAVVGAAGLAIGLAWQNTLSHFAAGVMLISLRPFEVGDAIEGGEVKGVVDAIGIFSTTLVTDDHVKIIVPNNKLFDGTLKNTTAMGTRRVDLKIDIGDRPIRPTVTELLEIVQSHPLVLDNPPPTCLVAEITPDSTILSLRPWCASVAYEQVRSQIQEQVKEAMKADQNQ